MGIVGSTLRGEATPHLASPRLPRFRKTVDVIPIVMCRIINESDELTCEQATSEANLPLLTAAFGCLLQQS